MVAPLAGDDAGDEAEGGDPVCWAYLVCEECGAITTEGHRAGCSRSQAGRHESAVRPIGRRDSGSANITA